MDYWIAQILLREHKYLGNYTHITKIPKEADLFVTSGQIGVDMEGKIPSEINNQVKNTFINIKKVLDSEELKSENIIKVNIWATEPIDWDFLYNEWEKLFGKEYPAMTIGYLSQLGLPELKIEIEIWGAKL